jgi:predicted dehydrogenase
MRVGIIGTGNHGSRYANHIVNDVPGLALEAVSRRSPEGREQAAGWNCRLYPDWQELVRDDQVEAVIAVVPPALNLDIAQACAEHGKPLLLEKPLAVSSVAASEIVELCRTKNLRLTVGQTLRYNPIIKRLRRELPSIGTLFSFSANQRLEPSALAWHSDPPLAGAGVSFHTAVHVFDAIRYITGLEVQRVMAVVRRQHNAVLEDLLAVLVEMEQNVVGTIDCSKVGNARSGRYEFVGYGGQLHGDQVHNTLEFIHGAKTRSLDAGVRESTIVPLLQDWLAFLTGKGKNPIAGEDGLASVRLCEACLESSRRGSWVVFY